MAHCLRRAVCAARRRRDDDSWGGAVEKCMCFLTAFLVDASTCVFARDSHQALVRDQTRARSPQVQYERCGGRVEVANQASAWRRLDDASDSSRREQASDAPAIEALRATRRRGATALLKPHEPPANHQARRRRARAPPLQHRSCARGGAAATATNRAATVRGDGGDYLCDARRLRGVGRGARAATFVRRARPRRPAARRRRDDRARFVSRDAESAESD